MVNLKVLSPLWKAVFLDRDGTLNLDVGYPTPDRLVVLPRVGEALRALKEKGFLIIMFTNQSGIARGYFSLSDFWRFNRLLSERLQVSFDDILFCPHKPEDKCICRKPSPYLIELALRRHLIDKRRSWIVGDSYRDLKPGYALGIKTALVLTGRTKLDDLRTWDFKPDLIGENLMEIAEEIILRDEALGESERTR